MPGIEFVTRVDNVSVSSSRTGVETQPVRGDIATCAVCVTRSATSGMLCYSCRESLIVPDRFCPEQIISRPPRSEITTDEEHSFLIDAFGRPHRLTTVGRRQDVQYFVGRDPRRCEIAVADIGVSMVHACIEYSARSRIWMITDNESVNGVVINRRRILRGQTEPLENGQPIRLGAFVEFYFVTVREDEFAWAAEQERVFSNIQVKSIKELAPEIRPNPQPTVRFVIQRNRRLVLVGDSELTLTSLEASFLLALQAKRDRDRREESIPDDVKGFLSTDALLRKLPFGTKYPEAQHLKDLIRRIRRRFSDVGVRDSIEGRRNVGYRLVV